MYMPANSSNPALPKPSCWRQRRPDLTLVKSSHWSYSPRSTDRAYPSPPMSNSPTSPSRRSSQFVEDRSAGNLNVPGTTSAPGGQNIHPTQRVSMEGPMLATPAPVQQPQRYTQYLGTYQEQRHPRPIFTRLQDNSQYQQGYPPASQPSGPPMFGFQGLRDQMPPSAYQGPISIVGPANPRMARTSRRAKAHVARACQNCKKAHLSCDEARPCARCVGSGKQATCIDVEHKKRGRPRLRDDREHRLEQAARAEIAAQGPVVSQPLVEPPPGRGHRRGDSLRVLRSSTLGGRGTTEGQNPMVLPAPDTRAFSNLAGPGGGYVYAPYSAQPPEPVRQGPLLTAFLNMDLQILKASPAFTVLLADGHNVRTRALSEFVANQHEPSLQRLQSELRDERTRREPTFLPGIFPGEQEQDAVQNYNVEDVDSLSHPYDDRRDAYTFLLANGGTERIQVRVRLARTSTFFATIVLYRANPQAQPTLARSAFARRQSFDPYSSMAPLPSPTQMSFGHTLTAPPSPYTSSAPGSPFSTLHTALMTTLPPSSHSIPGTYASSPVGLRTDQQQSGYFIARPGPSNLAQAAGMYPPPPPSLSRPQSAISEPRPSPTTQRDRHRPEPLGGGSFQLPPINSSAPTTPITSQFFAEPASVLGRRPSTDRPSETDEEEETRKRRRLNITEIIEK